MSGSIAHIFFVEDEPDLQQVMQITLDGIPSLKYKILNSAEEALEAMEKELPDAVVCDHYLPKMTGVNLLINVKDKFPSVKRYLLTGAVDQKVYQSAKIDAQVVKIFEKPLIIEDIIHEITGKL